MKREVSATLHSPPLASIVPPSELSTTILTPMSSREMHEYSEGPIVSAGPTVTGGANALSEGQEATVATSILATEHPPCPAIDNDRRPFFTGLIGDVRSSLHGEQSRLPSFLRATGNDPTRSIEEELVEALKDKYFSHSSHVDLIHLYTDNISTCSVLGAHSRPRLVLNTIRRGYVIPFSTLHTRAHLNNNRSAIQNSSFVSDLFFYFLFT